MPRPRCVGLIETCEESGSSDLPGLPGALAPRIGDVAARGRLDSGCGNYEQLWVTTSLRGLVGGVLTVEVLTEGVHSGEASGIVPSSFRIARQLLDRIEDATTGEVLLPELHAAIPRERLEQAGAAGGILGDQVWKQFPWVGCSHEPGAHAGAAHAMPTTTDPVEAHPEPHLAAGAVGDRRRRAAGDRTRRATCCGRRPRSSSRCACRPRSTASAPRWR